MANSQINSPSMPGKLCITSSPKPFAVNSICAVGSFVLWCPISLRVYASTNIGLPCGNHDSTAVWSPPTLVTTVNWELLKHFLLVCLCGNCKKSNDFERLNSRQKNIFKKKNSKLESHCITILINFQNDILHIFCHALKKNSRKIRDKCPGKPLKTDI